jgi:DNA-binding NtrC family response regulator
MAKLLIVDEDTSIRETLAAFFRTRGHQVLTVENVSQAAAVLAEEGDFDLVLSDWGMCKVGGLELLREIKLSAPGISFIVLTGHEMTESAVGAVKAGASDYGIKPLSLAKIGHIVDRVSSYGNVPVGTPWPAYELEQGAIFAAASATMRKLFDKLRQAANSNATILLLGERGTGKGALARQIHQWSGRADGPFVTLKCTTGTLSESELFGHVQGAFTGALRNRRGMLEAADKGTLFLDEVADLAPPLQAMLLRFVQERSFERVGSDETLWLDTRIIASSSRDLFAEVKSGRFRESLFYALNVVAMEIPPLRMHPDDILPIAQYLAAATGMRDRGQVLSFSAEAESAILRYRWPGNIRELCSVITHAAVLATGHTIDVDCLSDVLFSQPSATAAPDHPQKPAIRMERARNRRTINVARILAREANLPRNRNRR